MDAEHEGGGAAPAQPPDDREVAELRRFLWEHTGPGRAGTQSGAQSGAGARPDNVRRLDTRRDPSQEVD